MNKTPKASSRVILRVEDDQWAILFDPDTGGTFGLDPVSRFIWDRLDGINTLNAIENQLRTECPDTPSSAGEDIREFVEQLKRKDLLEETP